MCRLLSMPRSTSYYQHRPRIARVDDVLVQRIKHVIDDESYLGYRMVWATLRGKGLRVNRKAVQRIMQLKRWQCHRRLHKSCYPRVAVRTSIAAHSNQRWETDFTCIWTQYDGLIYVNEVIDCADRSVVGHCISKRCRAQEAIWALEDACIKRFGILPRGDAGVMVRSDNGLVFASKKYRTLLSSYGLRQEFIHPHTPEQNGVVEAYHKTFKRECDWQHRFKTVEEATAVIGAWIDRYNNQRPHSRLGYLTPTAWHAQDNAQIRSLSV
ncbi:MAG: IS3 family transposase [Candidatus Eremiobacteraeota bacterium]|nr:IS3 family transposase [Candidatus Eremiobacteraeota bacterium]